jgi:hypothetical protein
MWIMRIKLKGQSHGKVCEIIIGVVSFGLNWGAPTVFKVLIARLTELVYTIVE